MVALRACILLLTAFVATILADPFVGKGTLNLVDNGNVVGCMQRTGAFSSNLRSCAPITGAVNTTCGAPPWDWACLKTSSGYCGSPDYAAVRCNSDIQPTVDAYWQSTGGINANIGLSVLMYGKVFTPEFNAIDGVALGKSPKFVVPKLGDYPPGGPNYVITWSASA